MLVPLCRCCSLLPAPFLSQSWGGYTSAADKQALARPAVEKAFLHSALELYSRAQESTILQENFLFTHDWGFQLKDIPASVRVRVWQGAEDSGCTPGMAEYVAGQVAGCEDCQVVAGEGHMVFFNDQVWRHVLDWACG